METIIESVLHPTDFSEGSRVAFHHALKAALLSGADLTLLNVSPNGTAVWADFPGVRETLERWGLLPEGSPKSAVGELGIDVRKTIADKGDAVNAVVNYLRERPADLIVLATHQRSNRAGWLSGSVAEPIARKAGESTLFIPGDSRGFVSADDGSASLRNILIPVAAEPRAQPALDTAARLVKSLKCEQGRFTIFHAGSASSMPAVRRPEVPGWTWETVVREGDVIEGIIEASKETQADLIVMATDGRNGFLDGLRGSHSERVLHQSGIPLMTIPVGSYVSKAIT